MKNLTIAVVLLASIAYGEQIGARKESTVSIFRPIQLLQGWQLAQLETRLLGNDEVPHLEFDRTGDYTLSKSARDSIKKKWMFGALNERNFENPEIGREFFKLWHNSSNNEWEIFETCYKLNNLTIAIVTEEQVKNDKLIQRLKELNEELEGCINNSGFSGFFKSIFCTIKLTISILVNTVTLPHRAVRTHSFEISKEMDRDIRKVLLCPAQWHWIPDSFHND